jgi:Flp pilus assembly CpaF family ATPase
MSNIDEQFRKHILNSYTFESDSFRLGTAMIDGHSVVGAQINVLLRTLNRHDLIAGATGTGKTTLHLQKI